MLVNYMYNVSKHFKKCFFAEQKRSLMDSPFILFTNDVESDQSYQLRVSFHLIQSKYSRLSISRIPRDSLNHFEISVPRHIRVERVRKTIN